MATQGANRLTDFLDGLHVETRWLKGHHIVWQTGQQNGPDGVGPENHTHCSAFAAALAQYLGIYVLRPPYHSQELLATAQVHWLGGAGFPGPTAKESDWASLGKSGNAGALDAAVAAANAGKLVIAGFPAPGNTSGHVAIIRPQDVQHDNASGPAVIMAGEVNARSISMQEAFKNHPGAWPANIQMFVHDTVLEKDVEASAGAAA